MGAENYETFAVGTNAASAYANAQRDASDLSGHQDGYSGDIQTSSGYQLYDLPEGLTFLQFRALVRSVNDAGYDEHDDEGNPVYPAELKNQNGFDTAKRFAETADETRGAAATVELDADTAKTYREERSLGDDQPRVFYFAGMGAC